MLPDPEAQDEWQVRSCLKLCGRGTQIPLCWSDIDVCFQAEDTWVLCFFTICVTDLTVDLFFRFINNCWFMLIYFLWNFSWFIAQIREALFCQVQNPPFCRRCHRFLLDKAHISLEVYKRPLLSITDYNVFHTGPGIPGHWGLLIRKLVWP